MGNIELREPRTTTIASQTHSNATTPHPRLQLNQFLPPIHSLYTATPSHAAKHLPLRPHYTPKAHCLLERRGLSFRTFRLWHPSNQTYTGQSYSLFVLYNQTTPPHIKASFAASLL
jgi:hypothetical protein